VSRMRIGDSPNQRTVYANGPGRSLLRSVLALQKKTEEQEEALMAETEARKAATEAFKNALRSETEAHKDALMAETEARKAATEAHKNALRSETEARKKALRAATDAHKMALRAATDAHKETTEGLENKIQTLTQELMILGPLRETAINIRERFYATYRRSQNEMRVDDPFIIDSGNRRAHAGDVNLDVLLFKNGLIAWEDTFQALYGISWVQAERLLGMRVYSPTNF